MYRLDDKGSYALLVAYVDEILYVSSSTSLGDRIEADLKTSLDLTISTKVAGSSHVARRSCSMVWFVRSVRSSVSGCFAALPAATALPAPTATTVATASAATATPATATATPAPATMDSPTVLSFDAEGRPIKFDVWLDDLHLYLQITAKDDLSLYDHTSGAAPAPPTTADSTARSQW
ncbi:unnamed protein product [Closterium sp. NIES-54]